MPPLDPPWEKESEKGRGEKEREPCTAGAAAVRAAEVARRLRTEGGRPRERV
jgi:hypothetical protein